jgi:hypothetical protein
VKLIDLTRGFSVAVDDEDFPELSKLKWNAWVGKNGHVYAVRTTSRKEGFRKISMHRFIMRALPNQEVDHLRLFLDDKVLDNRRQNLRFVTRPQNGYNRRKDTRAYSVFKGVSFNTQVRRSARPWRARIKVEGRPLHLGTFAVEAYAALAYDLKAVEVYGEFALTNFPVPGSRNWMFGEVST